MEAKHRQHYVPQLYLSAWTRDRQLYVQRGSSRFLAVTRNVAVQNDFYKLVPLSQHDIDVLRYFAVDKIANDRLRKMAEGWLDLFIQAQNIRKATELNSGPIYELEKELERLEVNFGEEIQSNIETDATRTIDELRSCDETLFEDMERAAALTQFLGFQYFRTRKMAEIAKQTLGKIVTINVEAIWGVVRVIFGWNLGSGLLNTFDTWSVEYMHSPPNSEFITSDQPLINLKALNLAPNQETKELELYYPLTPELAIIITPLGKEKCVTHRTLSKTEIKKYNTIVFDNSFEQVFARSEDVLDLICPLDEVGSNTE